MKDLFDENKTQDEATENKTQPEVNYEENDGWKFEATALTLEDTVLENDDMEIVIPKEKPIKKPQPAKAPKAKPAPKKSRNTGKFIATAIITAIVIGVLVWLGIGYYTTPNADEKMNPGNIALTVGDTDVSIGMYNYYYTCIYQNYLQYAQYGYYDLDTTSDFSKQTTTDSNGKRTTWDKVFVNDTIDQIKYITSYYEEALRQGVKLTDDQKDTIKSQLKTLKDTAADSDMSVDEYISETYGEYCGYATLEKMLTQCYIAENYFQMRSVEVRATEDEVQKYYKEHSDEYAEVPIAYLQMGYDSDDASSRQKVEKKAKKYAEKIKTVDDMKKALPDACADTIKTYVEAGYFEDTEEAEKTLIDNIEATLTRNAEGFVEDGLKWLFADSTKVGDCSVFTDEKNSLVYVILKTGKAAAKDDIVYSVRHILVMPESDEAEAEDEDNSKKKEFTEEQWAEAKKKADDILAEYNKGDKSEYSFALLAEKYTDDVESTSNGSSGYYGGLYAGTELGVMVKSFEDWSIDDARKYGDVDIVKSDFGYHIMFFVEKTKSYLYNCESAVIAEKENKFTDGISVVKHKGALSKVKVAEPQPAASTDAQQSFDDSDDMDY